MSPSKRQSVSALLAVAAVLGLPVANAAAALQATAPTAKEKAAAKAAAARKAAAAKKAAAARAAAAKKAAARRTVNGDTFEMSRWGPVTVSIVVQGNKIIEAIADLPMGKPRSAYINERVGPYLNAQVVQIQSAQIDLVSGATQTCEAYAQSLQSAIDRAGIKPVASATAAGAAG